MSEYKVEANQLYGADTYQAKDTIDTEYLKNGMLGHKFVYYFAMFLQMFCCNYKLL
jgi:hypothetical protein